MTQTERTRRRDEWKGLLANAREFLKGIVQPAVQEILEAEMTAVLQADKGERPEQRVGYRSEYYSRTLVTRVARWNSGSRRTGTGAFPRRYSRAGTVPSEVVLGGRKVAMQRPRVRAEGREVPLPTFPAVAQADPLNRHVVEQRLVGVATRHYARSLESVPAGVVSRGTSKSSVSRRFVAKTTAQLRAWQSAPLDGLDLVALLLDGVHLGDHCLVVALGIAADGRPRAFGVDRCSECYDQIGPGRRKLGFSLRIAPECMTYALISRPSGATRTR